MASTGRRLTCMIVLAGAGLAGGGCGAPPKGMSTMRERFTSDDKGVRLDLEVQQTGKTPLRLSYVLRNTTSQNVYLINKLYSDLEAGPDGVVFVTDPNLVYVDVREGGVVLSKRIVPVPEDMDVELPEVPCASVVTPGGQFQETIEVALPVRPRTPYLGKPKNGWRDQPSPHRVWFELGYCLGPAGAEKNVPAVKTTHGDALDLSSMPESEQRLFRMGPLSWEIPVVLPKP